MDDAAAVQAWYYTQGTCLPAEALTDQPIQQAAMTTYTNTCKKHGRKFMQFNSSGSSNVNMQQP